MLNLDYDRVSASESPLLTEPVTGRDHVLGPKNAPLVLVEYGDYQCPYCGQAYPVVKKLQKELKNRLRFAYRHFPLTQVHPLAMPAAKAAEAAGIQGKFWEMHDALYENQDALDPSLFAEWAADLKIDPEQFENDLNRPDVARRIREDRRRGILSGVNGTPTFFINDRRFDGPPTYEALQETLLGYAL